MQKRTLAQTQKTVREKEKRSTKRNPRTGHQYLVTRQFNAMEVYRWTTHTPYRSRRRWPQSFLANHSLLNIFQFITKLIFLFIYLRIVSTEYVYFFIFLYRIFITILFNNKTISIVLVGIFYFTTQQQNVVVVVVMVVRCIFNTI